MGDVYITGRITDSSNPRRLAWKLMGISTRREDAEALCETNHDFVRPAPLNQPLASLFVKPEDIVFPRRTKS
jgi:hypothetical protein